MNKQLREIIEIPEKSAAFLSNSSDYNLPLGVPYIGMGSSYFAALAFKYMGVNILPEMAAEFYNYTPEYASKFSNAVLISQSGRSSEVLWIADLFKEFTTVVNYKLCPLYEHQNAKQKLLLYAVEEEYSSASSYVNTLLALFKGFGFKVDNAIEVLKRKFSTYDALGKKWSEEIFQILQQQPVTGIYILASGPNIATAYQAALILSESTKICFNGMPMAQYDHGPKETAKGSIVIQILAKGKNKHRAEELTKKIKNAGAFVFTIEEPELEENLSIITNIIPFNFLAYYLAIHLNITETFSVGAKITEVKS